MRKRMKATNQKELIAEITAISKANPKKWVCYEVMFSEAFFNLYSSTPTRADFDTLQTFARLGGFLRNGKIVKPTKRWFANKEFIPYEG